MPIYEYECENCGKTEEHLQKFSDAPITTCMRCGGNLHKLISQSSFHLKGTGWYVTDYAKGKKFESQKSTVSDNSSAKADDKGAKKASE
jgi:putative FmdB family regulatory protein